MLFGRAFGCIYWIRFVLWLEIMSFFGSQSFQGEEML